MSGCSRRALLAGAEFRTVGQQTPLSLVPLNEIVDERFAVYWRIQTT